MGRVLNKRELHRKKFQPSARGLFAYVWGETPPAPGKNTAHTVLGNH